MAGLPPAGSTTHCMPSERGWTHLHTRDDLSKMKKAGQIRLLFNFEASQLLLDINRCGFCGTIHQFNQCHRSVVALTETELEDAQITAVACCVAWAEFVEQFGDHFTITQTGKCQTTVCQTRCLAQCQDRLCNAAQFLCFWQGSLDEFMAQQRHGHVAEHRQAVAAGAVEFS